MTVGLAAAPPLEAPMMDERVQYYAGDRVALLAVPRGFERRLHVGQAGVVLVGADVSEWHWCSVAFGGGAGAVYQMPVGVLQLVARGTSEEHDDAD